MSSKSVAVRPNGERALNTLLELINAKNVDENIKERVRQNLLTVQGDMHRLYEEIGRLKHLEAMVPELERLRNIERNSRSRLVWGNRWEPGDEYSGVRDADNVLEAYSEQVARQRHVQREAIPGASDTVVCRVVTTYVTSWTTPQTEKMVTSV